jgi:O-antigen/teichoic acid export membrane protein
MVLVGYGLEALVAQLVVRSVVLFGLSFWQKPYSIRDVDKAASKQILRVCTPLVATDILWLFYSLADQFTIIKLLGTKFGQTFATNSNAFYAQGRKLINIPGDFLFTPINRTVAVAIGNRSADPADLARTFMKAISLAVVTLGAIFGCCAILREPLILAVYTSKLAGAIPVFGIICLSEAFKLTGTFAGSALVAAGKSRIPLFAWILPYPIMAAGIGLTWHHTSLETIAWSYAAGMVAVNLVVTAAGFVVLKVNPKQVRKFWLAVMCVALISLIAYGLSLIPLRPWPHVLLATAVLPPVYVVIIGIVLARKPFAFLSRSGPSRLREAL